MSAAEIYQLDKRCAEICRDMAITGFGFDAGRAVDFSRRLQEAEATARDTADEAAGRPITRTKKGGFGQKDLDRLFFEELRAPILFRSELTKRPSLAVGAMRGYAALPDERLRRLALSILEYRRIRKVRSTYLDAIELGKDGRVHPSWLNYGAVSGRWSCQAPNLMNLPRPENDPTKPWGGIRSIYIPSPGRVLVAFDFSQLEMRLAAYESGDPVMIAACESSDLHSANAELIFGEAFSGCQELGQRKAFRSIAKQSGFAVCYMAEAPTVYGRIVEAGVPVTLRQVEAMLRRLRNRFALYYEWQERRLLDCIREGWTDEPITGRQRWVGHDPSPPEVANFPIQGGAAGLMNSRAVELVPEIARRKIPAAMVAQVHDSCVFDVEIAAADDISEVISRCMTAPIVIRSPGREIEARFPIEIEKSERWH